MIPPQYFRVPDGITMIFRSASLRTFLLDLAQRVGSQRNEPGAGTRTLLPTSDVGKVEPGKVWYCIDYRQQYVVICNEYRQEQVKTARRLQRTRSNMMQTSCTHEEEKQCRRYAHQAELC